MSRYKYLTFFLMLLIQYTVLAQITGSFKDARDNQVYKTITFESGLLGSTTWMAQNLNYKVPGSYAYNESENYRESLGLLYTYEAATKACPPGWHLPDDSEWAILINQFGGSENAAQALKSDKGWNNNGNGTNSSGFSALPAGARSLGSCFGLGDVGFWWSSSPLSADTAWKWLMYAESDSRVIHEYGYFSSAYSVRCLRD